MLSTYYVDATNGNDSWDGLAGAYVSGTNGPWKTIEKVNSMAQQPGDSVLFARGEMWRETLIPDSGSAAGRITYGAYGDENRPKPQLLASVEMNDTSDWYNVADNIWSTIPASPAVIGNELISNTSFTYHASGWEFAAQGGAIATGYRDTAVYDSSPAGYSVNVTTGGTNVTYIQFCTANAMSVVEGNYYQLTFRAKCTAPSAVPMVIELQKLTSPWTYYATAVSTSGPISTEWATYTVLYQANTTATDAGLRFYLGNGIVPDGANFSIDTLSFKQCTFPPTFFDRDVGNIIFNNGESCGVKKWNQNELSQQGDFYYDADNYTVKVYSTVNPASLYSDIEIESQNTRSIEAIEKSYITIQDYDLRYSDYAIWLGAPPDSGISSHDVTVRGCDISFVGGGKWQGTNRGGNAIAIYGNAYSILVENNRIWDAFDAGISMEAYVTWYGVRANQHDITIRNNVIWNCEYPIAFASDTSDASNIYIENNNCAYAGYGWSEGQRGTGENGNNMGYNLVVTERNSIVTNLYVRNNIFHESFTSGVFTAIYNYDPVNGFSDDIPGMANLYLDYNLYYESSGNVVFMQNNYGYDSAHFSQYQTAWGYDAHSIVALPEFLQLPASPYTLMPSDDDFKLQSNSPAIDSGTNTGASADIIGTTRPFGVGYDMGAYEHIYTRLAISATDATKEEGDIGLFDDFGGISLDGDNWDSTFTGSGSLSVADSKLVLNVPNGSSSSSITSKDDYGYNTFTFTIGAAFTGGAADIFGLYGGGNHILVRNDLGDGLWRLHVNDGTNTYTSDPLDDPAAGDVYSIEWKSDCVKLWKNGELVLSETSALPTGTIPVFLDKYYTGTATYESVYVGDALFIFTVMRTGLTTGATTVDYVVTGSGPNAANAADFGGTLSSGTVSFSAGETSKKVTIYVSGDTAPEPDEGFTVTLSNPSGNADIVTATATGTIVNDDAMLLGDANIDGMVNDIDAVIVACNWMRQSGAAWANGDFNYDGKVNHADAAILATNWLKTLVAEAATSSLDTLQPTSLAEQSAQATPRQLPGDANHDGKVDDTDAGILTTNWKTKKTAAWSDGDFNGDGLVNDADVTILARHWLMSLDDMNEEGEARDTVMMADMLIY